MKNKFYVFAIDSNLDVNLQELRLEPNEKIISQIASDGKMVITTEIMDKVDFRNMSPHKNLLLEEYESKRRDQ